MIVDLLKILKFGIANPLSRRIILAGVLQRDDGSRRLEEALEAYSRLASPHGTSDRIYTSMLGLILDTSSRFFGVDPNAFRGYLQSPVVRRGLISVLTGIAKYGITRPQILDTPFLVVWNFTNMCNLRCRHCYQYAGLPTPDELTLPEKIEAVHELANAGVVSIALSGGEPLMHPHFFPVLEEITQNGMHAAVATNGTIITKKMAKRLKEAGLSYVEISLDSADPWLHDEFRGVPGAWKRAVEGVKNCVNEDLFTAMATTITKLNVKEAPALIELAKSLGVNRFLHFNFIPAGRGAGIFELDLSPEEREELLRTLYRKARTSEIEVLSTAPQYARVVLQQSGGRDVTPTHFYLGIERGHDLSTLAEFVGGCGSCRLYCALQPNGDVTPCVFIPQWIVGNLREESFLEIWSRTKKDVGFRCFRDRERLGDACGTCKYRYVCGGCRARALSYFNDPFAPDVGCIFNRKIWKDALDSYSKLERPRRPVLATAGHASPICAAATVDIDPDKLNLKSMRRWITAHIELSSDHNVSDIDVDTIMLNNLVQAESKSPQIGDYDGDGVPDLTVKFDGSSVASTLKPGEVEITITGKLNDGAIFEDADTIRVT